MTDQFFQHGNTPSPEPLTIRDLQLKSAVYGWLLATEVQVRKTINGKPFVDLTLRDPHGSEIIGRYFDPPDNEASILREGSVVLVEGYHYILLSFQTRPPCRRTPVQKLIGTAFPRTLNHKMNFLDLAPPTRILNLSVNFRTK